MTNTLQRAASHGDTYLGHVNSSARVGGHFVARARCRDVTKKAGGRI